MNAGLLTAGAQVILSVTFLGGYFAILFVFLLGYVKADLGWREAIVALLGVITGSIGTVMSFWFHRQRTPQSIEPINDADPDAPAE